MRSNSLIFLVLIVGVGFWLYRNKEKFIPEKPLPNGGKTLPTKWNYSPNALADELYDVMSGAFTLSRTKEDAWTKVLNLPNDEAIVLTYNIFNKKYGQKGQGTLTQWIADEMIYDWGASVKNKLIVKLRSLGCS